MTRSLSGLFVAGLGLCAGGWIIMKALGRRRPRAAAGPAHDQRPAVPSDHGPASGQAVPRGPLPVPLVDLSSSGRRRYAPASVADPRRDETKSPMGAEGEDAWW